MNEHDKPRPVSGEIMTGGAAEGEARRGPAQPADFADAEFETVEAPRTEERPARFAEARAATGMDSLRHGTEPAPEETGGSRRGGPLFWAFGLTLVVLAFWVSGGHALVRNTIAPPVAETAQPLRIGGVASRVETHNGRDILFVDGRAENHDSRPRLLPPIEIAVTGNDGAVTRYMLGTGDTELGPGGRYSFSSRLEAPQGGVKTVSVAFREDAR